MKDDMKTPAKAPLFLLLVAGLPLLAQAHPGHAGGLMHGLEHPVRGLDHICAMLAIGLWAAQQNGKARWMLPGAFVAVMALGGFAGATGLALPGVEAGIAASVLILGLLIALAVRLPLLSALPLLGLFAIFHGHAHGAEMAAGSSALAYGCGFLAMTALLHCAGFVAAGLLQRHGQEVTLRRAGLVIAACGVFLAF